MTAAPVHPALAAAVEAARAAGEIGLRYYRGGFEVTIKPDQTPVTQADREAERAITAILGRAFPDWGVLGEEFGEQGATDVRWIIDPIDGTKNFVRGIPVWAVLIGLEEHGEITTGVVLNPVTGDLFTARKGEGAFANGERIRVSDCERIKDATVLHSGLRLLRGAGCWDGFVRLVDAASRTRGFGDYYGYGLVAEGKAEVYVEVDLKPWDIAPVKILVEEAGGRLTDFSGRPTIYDGRVLASNGRLHDEALGLLNRTLSPPGRGQGEGRPAMRLYPFRALRAAPELAARVAAPPYDVVSRHEAAALAKGNPLSFLHVGRSEIDLPDDVDPYDVRVYARARENLDRLVADRTLLREARPALYLYREVMARRSQVGVVGCVHVDDYERGVIKKHETTRPDKEDDRTRHILALDAQAEPVLLAYRGRPEIDGLVDGAMAAPALCDFTTADGVRHTVWPAPDPCALAGAFDGVPEAYVADGHHRSASAWRAARQRRAEDPRLGGDAECNRFFAVLVPAAQLEILAYNRVVRDLGGQGASEILDKLREAGRLSATHDPVPPRAGSFCVYLERRWHLLELPAASIDRNDPIRSLDVSLLEEHVLGPILGIRDQRTDKRIDFVGGIRGTRVLEARVDSGEMALAVSMYPTTIEQLMAVADAGAVMPPKSTWFEPKLLSGLFVHTLD